MTRLILSNGDAVNINFASAISDFEDLSIHRVTTDSGIIFKPEADVYGEILAAQVAHFLASTSPTSLLDVGISQSQNVQRIALERADDISDTILLTAAGGIGGIFTSLISGVFGGPVGIGAAAISALSGAINAQRDITSAKAASAAYELLFANFGSAVEDSITSLSTNIDRLGDSELASAQIFNAWLAFIDATVTAPSVQPLLRQFDLNLEGAVPGINDNFDTYTSTLTGLRDFTLSAYLDSEATLISRQLADKLAPLGDAAARAEDTARFIASLGSLPPESQRVAEAALAELSTAQAPFLDQLARNGDVIRVLDRFGLGLDVVSLLTSGLDLLNSSQQLDKLRDAITQVGSSLDQLAGDARLTAAFATPEGRADFVARAAELPVIGTNSNDTILGSSTADAIFGGDGNDTVSGGDGDDRIVGGAGSDSIEGGDGNDLIEPGEGIDTVDGGVGSDTYRGSVQDLSGDSLTFEFGDRVELFGAVSQLPSFGTDSITFNGNRVSFDFDLDGSEDFFFFSNIGAIGRPVVIGESVDGNGIRTVIIQAGDEAAFAINQPLNSGLAAAGQAAFGGFTSSGESFTISQTNITNFGLSPELRSLAITDTGRVFTVFEYDAGENVSFGIDNLLPRLFFDGVGGVIVELDPETGGFIPSTIRSFAFAGTQTDTVPNTPPDFGIDSVESINALAPLGGGEFLAIAEFAPGPSFDNLRTLEGGSDFAFKIYTSGKTEFLVNWSIFGDGGGTRTVSADTSPITEQVFAWRDFSNFYGGGTLLEVDRDSGEPTVVASFSTFEITSIAFQSDGSLIGIGGDEFGRATIFEIDPVGQTITPVEFIRGEFFPEEFDLFGDFQFKPETNGTSDDDTLAGTDADDRIDGGLGNDSLTGLGGDDDIFAGGGTDVINPGLGNDIVDVFESRVDVRGTLAELNGDRIRGFDQNDVLTFLGTTFSLSNIFLSLGSLEISIDADGDGFIDALVTLDGVFDLSQPLIVENGGGNTTIRLGEINVAPSATDDSFAVLSNEITFGNVLANDTDGNNDELALGTVAGAVLDRNDTNVQTVDLPSGAQIAFLLDGSFIYDPRGAFSALAEGDTGFDTFEYTAADGATSSTTATVTVEVTGAAANDDPVGTDDGGTGFTTDEDTAFTTGNVLGNDTDVDGDTLSVASLDTTGTLGLVTDNGDGTFDYDPNGAFEALGAGDSTTDSFSYTVSDGNGGTDTATVEITVNGVNDDPLTVVASYNILLRPNFVTVILNGAAIDNLRAVGNAQDNTIFGDNGNNRLDGKFGSNTLDAASNPILGATSGNDILIDRDGGDTMIGGDGDDFYRVTGGSLGPSTIVEQAGGGNDTLFTNQTTTVAANVETVRLLSGADIDVTGNNQVNEINGNNGANAIIGLDGNDTLRGAAGADTIDGGAGNDNLRGGNGNDVLNGDANNDVMRGDIGADTLNGGDGNDRLFGGASNDALVGGLGTDIFVFNGDFAQDRILDFDKAIENDRLQFTGYEALNGGVALEFDDFLITQASTRARIQLDLDRDGFADVIDLDGDGDVDTVRVDLFDVLASGLDATDFIL